MKHRRISSLGASAALVAGMVSSVAVGSAAAAPSGRSTVAGTRAPQAGTARSVGAAASSGRISFDVTLAYRNPAAAAATAQAVSEPGSPSFHRYLTPGQWEQRFSPTAASVARVTSWLRSEGLTVGAVTPDRLNVAVTGTVGTVERAFRVALGDYVVGGRTVRLASTNATVPAALAGVVAGVAGLSQIANTPAWTTGATSAVTAASAPSSFAPPPGVRQPQVCSKYWDQKTDTKNPSYGDGFASHLPYAVCGYTPAQFESAYGLTGEYAKGITGKGVTVAIVDAYVSSTLLADGQRFYQRNDPVHPLATSQFSELLSSTFNDDSVCGPSSWSTEQTLDVQAVHATAPGAHILYVGAENCETGLYSAVEQVVDRHLAPIVTDSWGDTAGDLLDPASDRAMFDAIAEMAVGTGVGLQFSSGDGGDNFAATSFVSPDYPASSPYVTAVGGTSLAVGAKGKRLFETGWSTSKSVLCTTVEVTAKACTKGELGTWVPGAPGAYDYGGGGGTSYDYAEPSYQVGVVPAALADRNAAITGSTGRVEPDISMDADPTTGTLFGQTQVFPNGTYYSQYRLGGTSLASPLLAGVMALADQAAGKSLGFVNPVLYHAYSTRTAHVYDVVPQGKRALARVDYVNDLNNADGQFVSVRVLDYQGPESFCDGTGNCETRPVTVTVRKGFDSMTGLGSPGTGFVGALGKY